MEHPRRARAAYPVILNDVKDPRAKRLAAQLPPRTRSSPLGRSVDGEPEIALRRMAGILRLRSVLRSHLRHVCLTQPVGRLHPFDVGDGRKLGGDHIP